jgi:hypothetical protein
VNAPSEELPFVVFAETFPPIGNGAQLESGPAAARPVSEPVNGKTFALTAAQILSSDDATAALIRVRLNICGLLYSGRIAPTAARLPHPGELPE